MPVAIVGMHRSGTSLVTRLLHDAGLHLGPAEDLMAPTPANPDGYWENVNLVDLNDEVLRELGGTWSVPPAASARLEPKAAGRLRASASALLHGIATREPWGWKDPRTSLTLPFWLDLLPGLQITVCVRSPLEVMSSLQERDGMAAAEALTLWVEYYPHILAAVPAERRVVTHYAAYFEHPQAEVGRLAGFLGLAEPSEVSSVREALRHHRFTHDDLLRRGLEGDVLSLYEALCEEALVPAGEG